MLNSTSESRHVLRTLQFSYCPKTLKNNNKKQVPGATHTGKEYRASAHILCCIHKALCTIPRKASTELTFSILSTECLGIFLTRNVLIVCSACFLAVHHHVSVVVELGLGFSPLDSHRRAVIAPRSATWPESPHAALLVSVQSHRYARLGSARLGAA